MNKNLNGWVKGNPICFVVIWNAYFCIIPLHTFFFWQKWRDGEENCEQTIFYSKSIMKKVPKFLSCLNVVKEIYSEMQSFFNISQKTYTFREARDPYFPFPTLLCATETFFWRGNCLNQEGVMSLCYCWLRHDSFDFLRMKSNEFILCQQQQSLWIKQAGAPGWGLSDKTYLRKGWWTHHVSSQLP